MEFGVGLRVPAEERQPLAYLLDYVREADRAGFGYVSYVENFNPVPPGGHVLDMVTLSSMAATVLGNMRIFTAISLVVHRGLIPSAKHYATLDYMTGGRLVLGLGPGSFDSNYVLNGWEPGERWRRFDEITRALRALLVPGEAPFRGTYYDTTGMNFEPRGAQRPHIPMYIASWGSDAGLRRVARLGDGWLSSAGPGHQSPAQARRDMDRLRPLLARRGKDPDTFPFAVGSMPMFVSDDPGELERHGGPGYVPRAESEGTVPQPPVRPDEGPHAHDMVGTPAECIAKVRAWEAAGAGTLLMNPRGPDPIEQMHRFMESVGRVA